MASCAEMKKGDVYYCKDCGLEMTVTKECKDCGKPGLACACGPCGPFLRKGQVASLCGR